MPYKLEEIVEFVDEQTLEQSELHEKIRECRDLWAGEPYVAEDGYESFTDNIHQIQADKSIALLGTAKRDLRIPIDDPDKKAKRSKKSTTENFIDGWIDNVNHLLRMRGEHDIQRIMAWYGFVEGAITCIPLIYKSSKGETEVNCIFWDRLWSRFDMGSRGLIQAAHVKWLKPAQIKHYYGRIKGIEEKSPRDMIRVIEHYCDTHYTVIIGDDIQKQQEHDVGFNPVIFVPCGFAPLLVPYDQQNQFKDYGETGFKNILNIYKPNNMIKSAVLTQAKRYRKPPLEYSSEDGNFVPDGDLAKSGAAIPTSKRKGQEIKKIDLPELPKELIGISQEFDARLQMAGVQIPYMGLQGDKSWSGLSLNVAAHATTTAIAGIRLAMETMLEEIAYSVTRQFSADSDESPNLGLKPIELAYKTGEGMKVETFKPKDIKPFRFKCNLEFDTPRDEMEKYLQARILREPNAQGDPLMDDQTIYEKVLKELVKDPDAVVTRKASEWVTAIPTVKLRTALLAFLERMDSGDEDAKKIAMSILAELIMMEQKQKNELNKTMMQGQQMAAMMGGLAPQPMQAPAQGMNSGAMLPMQGGQAGFTPPMMQSPGMGGMIDPMTAMRLQGLGMEYAQR